MGRYNQDKEVPRRRTLTKQNNPRTAEDDPAIHDEKNEEESRATQPASNADTKIRISSLTGKTEPASEGEKKMMMGESGESPRESPFWQAFWGTLCRVCGYEAWHGHQ
jgi:hypothetical protein